jgi:hypothetical protein
VEKGLQMNLFCVDETQAQGAAGYGKNDAGLSKV